MSDSWYRCDVRRHCAFDEWGDPTTFHNRISWTEYQVEKTTAKGVWLRGAFGERRFVLGKAKRQLACPTKELALRDALARKERHVWGCRARLDIAEDQRKMLEGELRAIEANR